MLRVSDHVGYQAWSGLIVDRIWGEWKEYEQEEWERAKNKTSFQHLITSHQWFSARMYPSRHHGEARKSSVYYA